LASTVTAAAVSKKFGAYQDAAVHGPVIITKNGRPRTVLIAYEDYLQLTKRDRRVKLTSAFGDDDLASIDAAYMDGSLDHLNAELLTGKHAAD
jgi:prevent-host-death family protein